MLKKIFHFSFVLGLICAICVFGVSLVYSLTFEAIEKKENAKKQAALSIILKGLSVDPKTENFEYKTSDKSKNYKIYIGKNPQTKKVQGWGIQVAEQGYSSVIQTMVGVDANDKIIAIEIVFQQDTPGLGAECVSTGTKKLSSLWKPEKNTKAKRPWFQEQFVGKPSKELKVGEGLKTISGATITSEAIARSVRRAIEIIRLYRNSKK